MTIDLKTLEPDDRYAIIQVGMPLVALALGLLLAYSVTWLTPVVVVLMGLVFYRIYFPLHDMSHYSLFRSRTTNRFFGHLLAALLATPFDSFREEHFRHHKHFGTPEDPGGVDYFVRFKSRRELVIFLLQPLWGANLWQKLTDYYYGLGSTKNEDKKNSWQGYAWVIGVQGVLFLFLTHGFTWGEIWRYPIFVVLPGATIFLFLSRLRMFLEHGSLDYQKFDYLTNPRPTSRTILSSGFEKHVLCGTNFNYHHEHHTYPGISSRHLPRLHAEMTAPSIAQEDFSPTYLQAFKELWVALGK